MKLYAPFSGWKPRDYQQEAWDYLKNGGKHAELIWHRRAGKDDVCLNHASCEMMVRPGNYWHMLPKANQVRKAIWEAVNPRTGKRRVMEAFPPELFEHRDTDMYIKSKYNGSTWQAFGSDNFESAIGSGPRGIVYSEWPQANPSSRGYFRPMITENDGYQIFIGTPRGKNHGRSTFLAAQQNPNAFAQLLTIHDTNALTPKQLMAELNEYVSTYGEAMGLALYEQEYECSFDAAILGAVYGSEIRKLEQEGRYTFVPHDPAWPVHVAMDIGRRDSTAIWFFQVAAGEIRVIDFYQNSGQDPDHYISAILGHDVEIHIIDGKCVVEHKDPNEHAHRAAYEYGSIGLPHDGKAKTFATKKSAEEQFCAVFGNGRVLIIPELSLMDGINAGRKLLKRAYVSTECEEGWEALRSYHFEWDDEKKKMKDIPVHDWSSHPADAWRYMAVMYTEDKYDQQPEPLRWETDRTFNEMIELVRKRKVVN